MYDKDVTPQFLALVLLGAVMGPGCSKQPAPPSAAAALPQPAPMAASAGSKTPASETSASNAPLPNTVADGPHDEHRRAAELMAQLTSQSTSVEDWEAAHRGLVELGVNAADVLKQALTGDDPLAREWAASILALNVEAATAARDELRTCLADESGYARANAAAALSLVPGEEAQVTPVLLELLRSEDAELRRLAVLNLGNVAAAGGVDVSALTPLLDDDDPQIVRPIVELMGRLGPSAEPALPRLQQIAFEQADAQLQTAARQAIASIEDDAPPESTPQ